MTIREEENVLDTMIEIIAYDVILMRLELSNVLLFSNNLSWL